MKNSNPSVTPRIIGDNEDVTSIVTENQQHIYLKEWLTPHTLERKMDVIKTYFDHSFNANMKPEYFRQASYTFSSLLDEMNELVTAMAAIQHAKL